MDTITAAFLKFLGSDLRDQDNGILRIRNGGSTVALDGGNDNVGIGTVPPTALHAARDVLVEGNLTVPGVFANPISEARLKRDIQPVGNALGRLLALRGVEFEWARDDLARLRPGRHIGLIADEVERVFPAWVHTDPGTGTKILSTQGFEGLVVEALREVSQRLDNQDFKVVVVETLRQLSQRVDTLAAEGQTLQQLKQPVDGLTEEKGGADQLSRRIDALITGNEALRHLSERMEMLERENQALRDQLTGASEVAPTADEAPPEETAPPKRPRRTRAKQ